MSKQFTKQANAAVLDGIAARGKADANPRAGPDGPADGRAKRGLSDLLRDVTESAGRLAIKTLDYAATPFGVFYPYLPSSLAGFSWLHIGVNYVLFRGSYRVTQAVTQSLAISVDRGYGPKRTILYMLYKCVMVAHLWRRMMLLKFAVGIIRSKQYDHLIDGSPLLIKTMLLTIAEWMRNSKLLEFVAKPPLLKPEGVRRQFMSHPFVAGSLPGGHTHPEAAMNRAEASSFIDSLSASLGLRGYFHQMSRQDQQLGRDGSRHWRWAKDLAAEQRETDLPERPLHVYVDVDQYINMPEFLSRKNCPTLLYTFQPHQAARESKEYCYTFERDNTIRYNVTGGAEYRHKVWNYSMDSCVTTRWRFGLPVEHTSYWIDRHTTAPDHELIMLTPGHSWGFPWSVLGWLWIEGGTLERLEPVVGDYARVEIRKGRSMMSTAVAGSYAVANIPSADDTAIGIIAAQSKYPLSIAQVTAKCPNNESGAAVLMAYHRDIRGFVAPNVCPIDQSIRRYQFEPDKFDPAARPIMRPFMSPFVNDGFAPDRTSANERNAVLKRVVEVRPKPLVLTRFILRNMEAFIKHLIPISGLLTPAEHDEVWQRQNRPTQQLLLNRAEGVEPNRQVSAFMKAESYQNVKPPRIIATINTSDKRDYSCYTYAFEKVIKACPWYAFSKTPREIAERVAAVCLKAQRAANTDFSKFDGHGSNLMRHFELLAFMRGFHPEHHERIRELHQSQYGVVGRMTFGTKFDTDYMRTSGSPDTSLFNSMFNAFIAFMALNCQGVPIEECWDRLGIYGGDDGLTGDIEPRHYVRAAYMVGQVLTFEPVERGNAGIKFLARYYSPSVWYGDPNSMCDVKRQLSKFHLTVSLPPAITPVQKLLEKTRSFRLSDSNTPGIGEFLSKVVELNGEIEANHTLSVIRPWSYVEGDNQYPNEPGEWMNEMILKTMPEANWIMFQKWLDGVKMVEDMLKPPQLQEQSTAKSADADVVVDDDVIRSSPPPDTLDHKHAEGNVDRKRPSINLKTHIRHKSGDIEEFESFKQRKAKTAGWVEKIPGPPLQPRNQRNVDRR